MSSHSASPIICPIKPVQADWIDYNGHMNMAYYHVLFDQGVDFAYDKLGIGAAYLEQGGSCFTREVHVNYLSELALGDAALVTWQLLDVDAKRLHFFQHMYKADTQPSELVATSEQLALHVDMNSRRTAPFPGSIQHQLQQQLAEHSLIKRPSQVGGVMGIRR